jgi:hypothetical protein
MQKPMKLSNAIMQMIYKKLIHLSPDKYNNYLVIQKEIVFNKLPVTSLGEINLKYRLKIISICTSFFFFYCFSLFRFKSKNIDKFNLFYSLTYEQLYRNRKLLEFYSFITSPKINLSKSNLTIVEYRGFTLKRRYKNVLITFDIPLRIFSKHLPFVERFKLLGNMIERLLQLFKLVRSSNYVFMVAKEYIFDELVYQALAKYLNVDLILITQSMHNYQPLIFELNDFSEKKIMLWYSTNSMPLKYKDDSIFRWIQNEDIFRFMRIDTHWVWTQDHRDYLSSLTNANIEVKGVLMFYLDDQKSLGKTYDLTIFDVTPKLGAQSIDTIFNGEYAKKFLSEIVLAATEMGHDRNQQIKIALKSKRSYKEFCDPSYSILLDSLAKNKVIDVIPPETNIFHLIRSSRTLVVYPFSSPAVIGREMMVPTIFYNPSDYLLRVENKYGVPVVNSLNQLIEFLSKEIIK